MSLFLTEGELRELTGTPMKSRQIDWLRQKRWRYETTREGHPRVARAYFNRRMVDDSAGDDAAPQRLPRRLDFSLIKGGA